MAVKGTDALGEFMDQRDQIAADVVSGDAVAGAFQSIAEQEREWNGSLGELMTKLNFHVYPTLRTEKAVATAVRRNVSVLKSVGVEVEIAKRRSHKGKTQVHLRYVDTSGGTSPLDNVPPQDRRSDPLSGPSGARGARNSTSTPVLDFQQEIEEKEGKSLQGEHDMEVSDVPLVPHVPQDSVHELLPDQCPDCGTPHPQGAVYLKRCEDCWALRDEELLVDA